MFRISLLCAAALALTLAAPTPAQSSAERDGWMKRVVREENEVPAEVIQKIAKPADARALKDLKKAVKLFDKPRPLNVAYSQFRVFRKDEELQSQAIKFLADEVEDRKVQYAQYALNALNGLMPESRITLMEIAQEHENEALRARALRHLLGHLQENPTKAGLELILDGFRMRQSGNGSAFVNAISAFPLTDYRRVLEKRMRDRNYPSMNKQLILTALARPPFSALRDLAEDAVTDDDPGVARAALQVMIAHNSELKGSDWKKLGQSPDPALRLEVMVLRARQGLGRASVEKDLQNWVGSQDAVRRQAAARALALKPGPEAVEQLATLLADEHLPVRLEAARSLGAARRTDALEVLIQNAEHESRLTADLVQRTLTALTDQEFGPTVSTWARWWNDHRASFVMPAAEVVAERLIELRKPEDSEERTGASFWGMPIVSRRVVFVLDTSGSMNQKFSQATQYGSKDGTRLSAAKAQLVGALKLLPDGTLFNIITFDTRGDRWKDEMMVLGDATRREASQWVNAVGTRGATNVFDALDKAFALKDVDTIYLLSDGQPFGGKIDDPMLLRQEIRAWNATRRIPVHSISLGGDVALLRRLAEDSGGVFRLVK